MTGRTILVVDDEPDMRALLRRSLEPDLDCQVRAVASGREALELLKRESVDLVLADIRMPGMDGLEFLSIVKQDWPDLTVLIMTGHGSIEAAVTAMRNGAYDFITKPFDREALVVRLEKALERCSLIRENLRLKQVCADEPDVFAGIVGRGPAMRRVFESIRMVAKTDLTVLVTGESGTGKELTARAIHRISPRKSGPYVPVNCPTVPEQILESELFGYRKGAFTHATRDRDGLFQEAHGGTIFLDEIGDVSPSIQTKLLRVLQEKEIKPLGDTRTIKVDARIVASTNQDLRAKIRSGEFREDFFYRLNVLPVHLPPLRERREDIPLIADHLLSRHAEKLGKPARRFSTDLMALFMERPWQGNVRELENVVIQGILFSSGEEIRPADMVMTGGESSGPLFPAAGGDYHGRNYRDAKERLLREFNESYIGRLLRDTGGNVTQAARICGLERQSLQQVMRRYGIDAENYRGDR